MIRYPISARALKAAIEAESTGWLKRAAKRTQEFKRLGRYAEESSIWSEVKPAYMKLQGGSKCAYCERKLESMRYGKGEQDVEHFRPKGRVRPWKVPHALLKAGVRVSAAPARKTGYYLLPYHPFNYAAACKSCNSALKADRFPIAGTYDLDEDDPARLTGERPYLIYPIGSLDQDPASLIEFHGLSPRPRAKGGHARNRALVTIAFFQLDDPARKNLMIERAWTLIALLPQLKRSTNAATAAERTEASALVGAFERASAPHANCARSFRRLFDADPAEAEAVHEKVIAWLISIS